MPRFGWALMVVAVVAPAWADGVKAPATPVLDLNLPAQPYDSFMPLAGPFVVHGWPR